MSNTYAQTTDQDTDKTKEVETTEKVETTDEDILETAHHRFNIAAEVELQGRKDGLEDLRFSIGEQWPLEIKAQRDLDRRPCLTVNRLSEFIRQVTNDQRQNRQSIKVSPVDDHADIETAEIIEGMIRHIEQASDADTVRDTAVDSAVRTGLGYLALTTDYCDPMSFDLDIKFRRIKNRFSVYFDPFFQLPDGSDANWAFITEEISKDEFKRKYPKAQATLMDDWASIGESRSGWFTKDAARIAEYFYKEYVDITLQLLSDGSTIEKGSTPLPESIQVVKERKSQRVKICWVKLNGMEILEKTVFPGRYIPVIPVLGEEVDVEGKRILAGIVKYAKDPQRMYNYWLSAQTEAIALAPKAPFIGAEGQFEGFESQWQTANTKNHAFLQFKPKTIGGQLLGPPQRQVFEPPVQAINQSIGYAVEDLKATTGIYDAGLGNKSNETSGVAIGKRREQSQTSNFHFLDNLAKSNRHIGRILVDIIPEVYDTARAVRILDPEGQEEIVQINQYFNRKGENKYYDLSAGTYDVIVESGPSFATKRQEAQASMVELTKAYPPMIQTVGDLIVRNMDWPGKDEIADRLRKMLPPGLIDDKNQKPLPPEVQQQMTQMHQLIDQLTQHLNATTEDLKTKRLELESKERIETMKVQAEIEIELARLGSQSAQSLLEAEVNSIKHRLDLLHANLPIDQDTNNQNLSNGTGSDNGAAMPPQQPQPTGGSAPGTPME